MTRVSRFASKQNLMLPTIVEEESYEQPSLYGSSPASSWHSDSFTLDPSWGMAIDGQFDQQYAGMQMANWHAAAEEEQMEVDEDELLLAAIDMRLQELLYLRGQRQAAAAASKGKPSGIPATFAAAAGSTHPLSFAPGATATLETKGNSSYSRQQPGLSLNSAWGGGFMPAALAGSMQAAHPSSCPTNSAFSSDCRKQPSVQVSMAMPGQNGLPPRADLCTMGSMAPAPPCNDAAQMAALKLQQMQEIQRLQMTLQQELFQLLQQGC